MQLLLGKPVYMDDVTPDALVVKILRSPHANAIVQEVNTKAARLVPGVVDVYTWEDVPKTRFAIAHAIARATGVWHRELPITPEKVAMSVAEQK